MKRVIGAILIALLGGLYLSFYAIDAVHRGIKSFVYSIRGFLSDIVNNFSAFCSNIGGTIFKNNTLTDRYWGLIGAAVLLVIFFIIYFVVFGLIAHSKNKKLIAKKKEEGDTDFEIDHFPTKRIIFAILIFVGIGFVACCYAIPAVRLSVLDFLRTIVRFSRSVYDSIQAFCYDTVGLFSTSLQAKLSPDKWTAIFCLIFAIVFYIIYFLVFGLIARAQRNKKLAASSSRSQKKTAVEGKEVVAGTKKEKSDFKWQDYKGGRPIKRVILAIVLSVALLFVLVMRFFNYFTTFEGYAINALKSVFEFFNPVFKGMTVITDNIFSWVTNDVMVGSLMNNAPFTVHHLLDFIFWLLLAVVAVVFIILVCTLFVHIYRRKVAQKRAQVTEDKYLSELNSTPKEDRLYVSEKASEQLGLPTSKREGADISDIADINADKLTSSVTDDVKAASYIDDIANGVTYIGIAATEEDDSIVIHEIREDLVEEEIKEDEIAVAPGSNEGVFELNTIDEEKPVVPTHVVNLYQPDVDVDVAGCDVSTIAETEPAEERLDTNDIADIILFDDDGFAYIKSVGPRIRPVEEESIQAEEEIPETVEHVSGRSFDDARLVEDLTESNVVIEPEFTKTDLPIEETVQTPVNNENLPTDLDMSVMPSEEDKKVLNALEPFNLKPVEEWPDDVPTDIDDNGALHVLLEDENNAIVVGNKEIEYAPVIEEVLTEEIGDETVEKVVEEPVEEPEPEAKPEPKPLVGGIRPVAPIHPIRTPGPRPDIKPIVVTPKEEPEVVEEEKTHIVISKPLHEINESSKKKDIAPIKVDTRRKFDLKRFSTSSHYTGKLSSMEAFERGVTKVNPTIAPVTSSMLDDTMPEWMRRRKEKEIKETGYSTLQVKDIEEVEKPDVTARPSKPEVFSLRRHRKTKEEESTPIVEEDDNKVSRPIAPIKLVAPIEKPEEEPQVKEEIKPVVKPIVKPLQPIKKPVSGGPKPMIKPLQPKKVTATVIEKNNKDDEK